MDEATANDEILREFAGADYEWRVRHLMESPPDEVKELYREALDELIQAGLIIYHADDAEQQFLVFPDASEDQDS
jgi:hypothetical protein